MTHYMLSGFYAYDSIKQIAFSCIPEFARALWCGKEITNLTKNQKEALEKMNQLKDSLCQEADMNPSDVKITLIPNGEPIITLGGLNQTVISVNARVIPAISDQNTYYFMKAYEKRLNELSDDPVEMAKQIKKMETSDLHIILGHHDRLKWELSDEEWRFVLGHEIKGHAQNNDNSWITGLYITTSLAMLIGTNILFPSMPMLNITLSISISKLAVTLMKRYCETKADLASIQNDPVARKGALQFFKKGVIYELAQSELQSRRKESRILQNVAKAVQWTLSVDHPSASLRYKTIQSQNSIE